MKNQIAVGKPSIGIRERLAVDRVLRSGQLAQGKLVAQFENLFADASDARFGVALNSGTSGLHIALLALGVGAGDEVLVPAFTFAATANAVALTGAKPVFVDIDSATLTFSASDAASKISSRTVGMIPVHLYGLPANMSAIRDLAESRKLFILEDAAQSHLAEINGRKVGSLGNAAVFSFYPTKNMTTGEGGMVTTSDEALARKMRILRNQGMEVRYQNELVGLNNRMTEISAAIGIEQLKRLPSWTSKRIENAAILEKLIPENRLQLVPEGYRHVYHQFTMRVPAELRPKVLETLRNLGVGCDVYYPTPVSQLASFKDTTYLPESALAASEVVSIPVRQSLSNRELKRVEEAVEFVFATIIKD
ncbi:MAG: hypothetical protein RL718_279 [Actinomycetota bacterium]|jgi:dTDP-4-amino-4,6-dideoxygalactose transaminase